MLLGPRAQPVPPGPRAQSGPRGLRAPMAARAPSVRRARGRHRRCGRGGPTGPQGSSGSTQAPPTCNGAAAGTLYENTAWRLLFACDGTQWNLATQWNLFGGSVPAYPAGVEPGGIAFDGTNMWVANSGSGNVTKLSPSGVALGTYAVGTNPNGVAFDGTNMWVTNTSSNNVTKLSPSGAALGTYAVNGTGPWWLAFDGDEHVGHQPGQQQRHQAIAERFGARHLCRGRHARGDRV